MWKSVFNQLPNDNEEVWIRVVSVYGEIAKATYDDSTKEFITSMTEIIIPAYQISRWKSQ